MLDSEDKTSNTMADISLRRKYTNNYSPCPRISGTCVHVYKCQCV